MHTERVSVVVCMTNRESPLMPEFGKILFRVSSTGSLPKPVISGTNVAQKPSLVEEKVETG